MLSYAFKALREEGFKKVETEEFEHTGDLFAAILAKGISYQLKRGLHREYVYQTEETSVPRGKIDISDSIRRLSVIRNKLVCSHDEFSENSYLNRIVKTTVYELLKHDISTDYKKQLRRDMLFFQNVDLLDPGAIDWHIRYDRNNKTYELLVGICYLTLRGLIHKEGSSGKTKLMDFLDDQEFSALYEKFLLEFYRQEYRGALKAESAVLNWNIEGDDYGFLPHMITDVTLRKGNKTLIIDAKFYGRSMQQNMSKKSYHSGNMYQIYSYVKNMDKHHTGNVSGMLLYARTDEEIVPKGESFRIDNNRITIDSLDLNREFKYIREDLDKIVTNWLEIN